MNVIKVRMKMTEVLPITRRKREAERGPASVCICKAHFLTFCEHRAMCPRRSTDV